MSESPINAFDCDGYRPVHRAVMADDLKFCERLVMDGALLNAPTEDGEGVLSLACRALQDSRLEIWLPQLLSWGAEIIDRNPRGDTALHIAIREHKIKSVQILMASGADPLMKNAVGERPVDLVATLDLSLQDREALTSALQPINRRS